MYSVSSVGVVLAIRLATVGTVIYHPSAEVNASVTKKPNRLAHDNKPTTKEETMLGGFIVFAVNGFTVYQNSTIKEPNYF